MVSRRHPGRWVAAAVCLVLVAMLAHGLVTNPRWQWSVVGDYIVSDLIVHGALITMELTVVAFTIQVALGTAVALMRLSPNPVLRVVSSAYIWFFRGTPLLVQLLFWYNISALYPKLSVGIPFGPEFVSGNVNQWMTTFMAALIGLGLNESAYTSEIIRAGILSVDRGQMDGALSVGMTRLQAMRRVVLPQALKVIIPPLGNSAIAGLKITSLVSVISMPELLGTAENIYSATLQTIPLLIVVSLWYLLLSTVLTFGISAVESLAGTRDNLTGVAPSLLSRLGGSSPAAAYLRRRRAARRPETGQSTMEGTRNA